MILGLTIDEVEILDAGDLQHILELTPGYLQLPRTNQKELEDSLRTAIEQYDDWIINPFYKVLLEAGARRFIGEIYMESNIFSYIKPARILALFDKKIALVERLNSLYQVQTQLEQTKARQEAIMAAQDGFKWGSNETSREAQSRAFAPDTWDALDRVVNDIKTATGEVRLVDVEIEMINTMQRLFTTSTFDIPAENRSPA